MTYKEILREIIALEVSKWLREHHSLTIVEKEQIAGMEFDNDYVQFNTTLLNGVDVTFVVFGTVSFGRVGISMVVTTDDYYNYNQLGDLDFNEF